MQYTLTIDPMLLLVISTAFLLGILGRTVYDSLPQVLNITDKIGLYTVKNLVVTN